MGAARGPGSQASLSALYFQAVLPTAKEGWAAGPSLGSQWGGGIRLGDRQTWALKVLSAATSSLCGLGQPLHLSLTLLICKLGEQSPSQRGPIRKKQARRANVLCDSNVLVGWEGSTSGQVWNTCRPVQGWCQLDSPAYVFTLTSTGQRLRWQTTGAGFPLAGFWWFQSAPFPG